ncbi:glycosyltransferase [Ignatzschineria sp. RMDPL8A]|uniref:glycosyltransferase family 2 protein n=1 Tax=Ignatzschineria sp. RMDPL8A TaxID=2999236 RepID=UPI00244679DB|nr:glycosyltransferase [Ignatzschineria sp. RMDPL8A]MDG9729832.1 glycosyltransferase [Ignatzschineria sp. RMDPL8A]
MNKNPTISIIIPVYGVEDYIEKCIQSLLDQTYTHFEAIIVDDGSLDNSIAIAKKLVGNDPRFIFLEKENGGQSSARNLGLDIVSGDYIAFVDSDDYISPKTFEYCIHRFSQKKDTDIVTFGLQYVDENGESLGLSLPKLHKHSLEKDPLLFYGALDTSMSTKIYKKKIFENIRFIEGMIYEDQQILPAILYNQNIDVIDDIFYFYVIHSNSTMRRYNPHYLTSFLKLFDSHKSFLCENYPTSAYKKYYETGYLLNFYVKAITYISIYSPNFNQDYNDLNDAINKKIIKSSNILNLLPLKSRELWAILIFKTSPKLFKFIFKSVYKRVKNTL